METPPGPDAGATVAPSDGTSEHRAIAQRIVWVQTQLTATRRRLAALHAQRATAYHPDDLGARVAALHTDLAQHAFELKYWVARLDRLPPRPRPRRH